MKGDEFMTTKEYVETMMWAKSSEGVKAATSMFLLSKAIEGADEIEEDETYPAK